MKRANQLRLAIVYLRWSLGLTFLSACADRFGTLGGRQATNAQLGDWAHFVAYSATLNWYLPASLQSRQPGFNPRRNFVRVALIIGLYLAPSPQGSAVLLALSALATTLSVGIKSPLNSSVSSTLERHGYWVTSSTQMSTD